MAGMDGQWIYNNFQDGQGPDGLVGGAAIVNEVAADYETRAQQIRALTTRMESAWQGDAAGAAQRGAGPIANEHELSGPSLATAQDLTNRQAGSYADAKNAVVPVPPKPELANPLVVFTSPDEWARFEDQVDDYNAAAQHNVDVMHRYGGASSYNTTNLPFSYGTLTADQAGIGVGPGTRIDSEDFSDAGGSSGGDGRASVGAPGPGGGDTGGAVSGGDTASPGGSSLDTATRPDAGTTTPGGFTPSTPTPVTPVTAGTDSGIGTGRPPSGPLPSVGVVAGPGAGGTPGSGSGSGAGPGGGRAGGGAGPRGGVVRGPGASAEPSGPAGRSGPAGGVVGAAGRGGSGMSGVPIGAAGRSRDGEDSERTRPAYLEGGDPDELFDTDEKTAPPVLGENDD